MKITNIILLLIVVVGTVSTLSKRDEASVAAWAANDAAVKKVIKNDAEFSMVDKTLLYPKKRQERKNEVNTEYGRLSRYEFAPAPMADPLKFQNNAPVYPKDFKCEIGLGQSGPNTSYLSGLPKSEQKEQDPDYALEPIEVLADLTAEGLQFKAKALDLQILGGKEGKTNTTATKDEMARVYTKSKLPANQDELVIPTRKMYSCTVVNLGWNRDSYQYIQTKSDQIIDLKTGKLTAQAEPIMITIKNTLVPNRNCGPYMCKEQNQIQFCNSVNLESTNERVEIETKKQDLLSFFAEASTQCSSALTSNKAVMTSKVAMQKQLDVTIEELKQITDGKKVWTAYGKSVDDVITLKEELLKDKLIPLAKKLDLELIEVNKKINDATTVIQQAKILSQDAKNSLAIYNDAEKQYEKSKSETETKMKNDVKPTEAVMKQALEKADKVTTEYKKTNDEMHKATRGTSTLSKYALTKYEEWMKDCGIKIQDKSLRKLGQAALGGIFSSADPVAVKKKRKANRMEREARE